MSFVNAYAFIATIYCLVLSSTLAFYHPLSKVTEASSGSQDPSISLDSTSMNHKDKHEPVVKSSTRTLQKRQHGPLVSDPCMYLTIHDPLNNIGDQNRDPHRASHWHDAPEFWMWRNASCELPSFTPNFHVDCRKVNSRFPRGVVVTRPGSCQEDYVCVDDPAIHNPHFPGGIEPASIRCIFHERAEVQRIRKDVKPQKWCSQPQGLITPEHMRSASHKLTMEMTSAAGHVEAADLWFEIIADWWKYGHTMFESRTGMISGVINTAPALGPTYVKFCAVIAAETVSKILPWVGIVYSHTVIERSSRRGRIGQHFIDMNEIGQFVS